MLTPIKNHKFSVQTLLKNSVFQKTSFHFHFFTQFLFHCEEFWDFTYKRPCSRSHTSFKAYRIYCNHSKRRVVQECLLGVKEKLCKLLSSWCREELYRFSKGCFVKWCARSWFWVYKINIRKILSRLLGGRQWVHFLVPMWGNPLVNLPVSPAIWYLASWIWVHVHILSGF